MSLKSIMSAMAEELAAMRSGHFPPYHKMAVAVAVITTVVFAVIFAHGAVFEGRIKVIDLDHTPYSQALINEIDSSSYIEVTQVLHYPADVVALTRNDACLGVLYIPDGFTKKLQGQTEAVNLGYFADYTNEPQNAEVMETLNEITGMHSALLAVNNVADDLALTEQTAQAKLTPLSLKIRRLFNPTFSATNSTIVSFIYFFSSLFLGLTLLMIPGRLRVTNRWNSCILGSGPLELMARVVPYAFFYTTAITVLTAILVLCGQLRFAGSYLAYLPSIFMTGLCFGLMALLYAWKCPDPGAGASLMIFLVPPGFILGGATMAIGIMPHWAEMASHVFPLVWQYSFWRDFAQRGSSLASMLEVYGWYLGYISVLGLLICLRFNAERKALARRSPAQESEAGSQA